MAQNQQRQTSKWHDLEWSIQWAKEQYEAYREWKREREARGFDTSARACLMATPRTFGNVARPAASFDNVQGSYVATPCLFDNIQQAPKRPATVGGTFDNVQDSTRTIGLQHAANKLVETATRERTSRRPAGNELAPDRQRAAAALGHYYRQGKQQQLATRRRLGSAW